MAKKTVARSKAEPKPAAAGDAAPAAKPRSRAKSKSTDVVSSDTAVANDAADPTYLSPSPDPATVPVSATESVSMASEPSEEDIRLRAYHRYLERGGGHGMDFEDWLEAKRDLTAKK
jgi:hypothetical protein